MKPQAWHHMPHVVGYVCRGQIDSEVRLNAALDFCLRYPEKSEQLDLARLEEACGMGVVVTPEQIERCVEKAIASARQQLLERRYRFPAGSLMAEVRRELPWADGKAVKAEMDLQVRGSRRRRRGNQVPIHYCLLQILDLLGPKTEADLAPAPKAPKAPKAEKKAEGGDAGKKGGGNKTTAADSSSSKLANGDVGGETEEDGAATIAELMRSKVRSRSSSSSGSYPATTPAAVATTKNSSNTYYYNFFRPGSFP